MKSKNFDLPTTTCFVLEKLVDKRYLCIERIRSNLACIQVRCKLAPFLGSLFEKKYVSNRARVHSHKRHLPRHFHPYVFHPVRSPQDNCSFLGAVAASGGTR